MRKPSDRQMLDWLEKNKAEVLCDRVDSKQRWFIETAETSFPDHYPGWKKRLRDAIKAAMKASCINGGSKWK